MNNHIMVYLGQFSIYTWEGYVCALVKSVMKMSLRLKWLIALFKSSNFLLILAELVLCLRN